MQVKYTSNNIVYQKQTFKQLKRAYKQTKQYQNKGYNKIVIQAVLAERVVPKQQTKGQIGITSSPLNGKNLQYQQILASTDEGDEVINTISSEINQLVRDQGIKYDHVKLAKGLEKRRGQVLKRALTVSGRVTQFIGQILYDVATNKVEDNYTLRAKQLVKMLSDLGPAFVKVGQALSSRPDLLPKQYLEQLESLQDQLPAFPRQQAISMIKNELKEAYDNFEYISDKPVAAASLGQVFKGKLKSGEQVAVKVQRPGIGEGIAVDMVLIRQILKIIDEYLNPFTQSLVPLLDEFAAKLFAELDYIQESKNCVKFTELYCNIPRIRTPKIYWELTGSQVLTMEWIEGVKLTDLEALQRMNFTVTEYVDVGIECTLKQLLEHGYFHADPHPGNLLATQEGDLVYLDFGMMSTAPKRARDSIIQHIVHLVNRDYEAMCRDYYDLEFIDPDIDTKPIAPALAAFFDDVLDQSVSKLNFRKIIDGLGHVMYSYPFSIPSYYALILKSLTVLEGLALRADKNYQLLGKAYPYVAKRILIDPSPQLRRSFNELILKDGQFRWNRLENLLLESGKRSDSNDTLDSEQVWGLANWVMSDLARPVREQFLHDVIKMVDALISDRVRTTLSVTYGQRDLAQKIFPQTQSEARDVQRAYRLLDLASLQVGTQNQSQIDLVRNYISNPFGSASSLDPNQITENLINLINQLQKLNPRLQEITQLPGTQQTINIITMQLTQRFSARFIKFSFGVQQQIQNQISQRLPGIGQFIQRSLGNDKQRNT